MENRVEALRRANGIKQEDLARAMGVSRQSIGSIENGRYNPSTQLAIKLARYFGLTVEEVFMMEGGARWQSADRLVTTATDTRILANYQQNKEIPLSPDALIPGQSNRLPAGFLMGSFHISYNGAVPVALANAGVLLGDPRPLSDLILELEGNDLVLLDGYAGVDPKSLAPYFRARGWSYDAYEAPSLLAETAEEGAVYLLSYWNDRFFRENKGMNTVCATVRGGKWVVYNVHIEDMEPRSYRTLTEALRGKKLFIGYRLER